MEPRGLLHDKAEMETISKRCSGSWKCGEEERQLSPWIIVGKTWGSWKAPREGSALSWLLPTQTDPLNAS